MSSAPKEEKKLAVVEPRVPIALMAETLDDVHRQARLLAPSQLVPKHLHGSTPEQTLANVTLVMAQGRELGLPPVQSLMGISVISGKTFVETRTLAALVYASGHCEYLRCVETTPTTCTWETKRKGSPSADKRTYTMEMAKTAGLGGKGNYLTNPGRMLSARACGWLLNDVYPDVTRGMAGDAERHDAELLAPEPKRGPEGLKERLRAAQSLPADTTATQRLEPSGLTEDEQVYAALEPTDEQMRQEREQRERAP